MVSYNHYNYSRYWSNRRYENTAEGLTLKKLLKKIGPRQSLIDIGAGYGRLFEIYSSYFQRFLLVEPSRKLLDLARKNLKYPPEKELQLVRAEARALPAGNREFDVALMIRVSHHLTDLEKPLQEINRVLKTNGYLIFEFANKINFKSSLKAIFKRRLSFFSHLPINLSRQSKQEFKNYHPNQILTLLAANGFTVIRTISVSNFRLKIAKDLFPLPVLLFFEKVFSLLTSHFSLFRYFGPSIFVMAQKSKSINQKSCSPTCSKTTNKFDD